MKTQIMFFFDTEDYVSPETADAVLGIIRMLEEEGVTGHFAVVGLFADRLTAWGRDDVKKALTNHVIGTHTYGHTMHPDIAEMSDGADYSAARARVMESELKAIELLENNLGIKREELMFATTPGNSISYVGMYCYHELGIPFYCDTVVYDEKASLTDYCSINQLPYGESLEYMFLWGDTDVDEVIDRVSGKERCIFYLHPNMCVKSEFWDIVNFDHENTYKFGQWKECKDLPVRETIEYFHKIRMFIRRLKQDERFELITLHDLKKQLDEKKPKPLSPCGLGAVKSALADGLKPISELRLSLSDVFYAVTAFLRGEDKYDPGSVKGLLYAPIGIKEPAVISRDELTEAAKKIIISDFIPSEIAIGDKKLGPADYLYAALELLTSDKDTVTVLPKEQMPDMSKYPDLENLDLVGGTWRRMWEFKDEYVSKRLRLQLWTLRNYK